MRRPLVFVAVAFTLGVALHDRLAPLTWWLLAAAGLSLASRPQVLAVPLRGGEARGSDSISPAWKLVLRARARSSLGRNPRDTVPARACLSGRQAAQSPRRLTLPAGAWDLPQGVATGDAGNPATASRPTEVHREMTDTPPRTIKVYTTAGRFALLTVPVGRCWRWMTAAGPVAQAGAILGAPPRATGGAALDAGAGPVAVVAVLIAMMGLGALAAAVDEQVPRDHYRWSLGGSSGMLEGIVASDPVWRVMPGRPVTQQAVVAVTAVGAGDARRRVTGRVWLRHHRPAFPLRFGDHVRIHGAIRPPHPPQTAGGFDEAQWLWLQHADGVIAPAHDEVEWLASARGWRRGVRLLLDEKHRAVGFLRQLVDPTTAALLATLLAGERTALPRPIVQAFQDTGTVHLLSVSGWHVTLIGGLLWFLSRLVLPRRAAAAATMLGLVAYCVLTGAEPPIVRATLVGLLVLAGLWLTRPADPLNGLGFAAVAILAVSPRTLGDVGFQLSFASVAALLLLAPPMMAVGRRLLAWLPAWGRAPVDGIMQAVAVSTAAWAGVAPLVAYHLHRVTLITWVANLVAVPLAALVMVTGLVVTVGAWAHPWLVAPWAGAAQVATHLLLWTLNRCAQIPGATVPCPVPPWWTILGWYLGLGLVAAGMTAWRPRGIVDPRAAETLTKGRRQKRRLQKGVDQW